MKQLIYLIGIFIICVIAALVTFTAHAQSATPNDAIQDKAVVKDQTKQDVKRTDLNEAQDEATAAGNKAQDKVIAANVAKVDKIESQAITDRQFMGLLALAVIGVLISVWWMQYRATSRLEGASKSTWEGIEKILLRTELLQAYLEREAPAVVADFEASLPKIDAK